MEEPRKGNKALRERMKDEWKRRTKCKRRKLLNKKGGQMAKKI
jgi:hypothetical protein